MSTLKLSPSRVESALETKPHLKKYADRLKAMDKDGNGELDLGEVCEVLDEMATVEKQRRLLKWVAGIMGVFTLLSIAAIVGLTFAVVDLSKDTSLSEGGVLQSRSGDATVATGQVISVQNLTDVYKLASADLQSITSLVIPEGDGERVVKVVEAFSVPGTSVTFTSATGAQYTVDAAGIQVEDGAGGRRLLADSISFLGSISVYKVKYDISRLSDRCPPPCEDLTGHDHDH